jgi:hypothetical protein
MAAFCTICVQGDDSLPLCCVTPHVMPALEIAVMEISLQIHRYGLFLQGHCF